MPNTQPEEDGHITIDDGTNPNNLIFSSRKVRELKDLLLLYIDNGCLWHRGDGF